MGSEISVVGNDILVERISQNSSRQIIAIQTPHERYQAAIRLLGPHQCLNAALAVGAIEALKSYGVSFTRNLIEQGLENASWAGRFQILRTHPLLVADAAHNPAGMRALVQTWKEMYGNQKCILIFGALEDKDVHSMIHEIAEIITEVWLVGIRQERAMEPKDLAELWKNEIPPSKVKSLTVDEIILRIQSKEFNHPVLTAGSIYLLGEFLPAYSKDAG